MILSIDIVEMVLGENVGAKLRADKAEYDKRIAQAEAEKRRTMAVAAEQENPCQGKRQGGVLDRSASGYPDRYLEGLRKRKPWCDGLYRMENVRSDTKMRESIAKTDGDKG